MYEISALPQPPEVEAIIIRGHFDQVGEKGLIFERSCNHTGVKARLIDTHGPESAIDFLDVKIDRTKFLQLPGREVCFHFRIRPKL